MRCVGYWYFLRFNVYREYKIKGYYADFAVPAKKVVIEVDGARWHGGRHDVVRDYVMHEAGWNVLRVPAKELWQRPAYVRRQVFAFTRDPRNWQKRFG